MCSMLLVPAFNTLFIKKGLHQIEKEGEPAKAGDPQPASAAKPANKTMLSRVQSGYDWLLTKAFGHA